MLRVTFLISQHIGILSTPNGTIRGRQIAGFGCLYLWVLVFTKEGDMSWRPEGWGNRYSKEHEEDGMFSRYELFEAGADAMLEKLKATGVYSPNWSEPILGIEPGPGWMVFIKEQK